MVESGIIYQIILLTVIIALANLPYKGRLFDQFNIKLLILCIISFVIGALILTVSSKSNLFVDLNIFSLAIIMTTVFLWFYSPKIIRRLGKYPKDYISDPNNRGRFLARFELYSMSIKFFEVLFQQSIFVYLLFVVLSFDLLSTNLIVFTLIIMIIHLGNLPFLGLRWTLFYTALSIPMALIFGLMIAKGYVLITISLHLLFYLYFNGRLWFSKN